MSIRRPVLTEIRSPNTIDLNLLGACNLRCPFCWGPAHEIRPQVALEDWKILITNLAKCGTRSIVFTGGEPLIYHSIDEIVSHAKRSQLRTTLSTNGILLPKLGPKILRYVDEIGIPLDGPDATSNNQLRISLGRTNHFAKTINALRFLEMQQYNPALEVTIRTVVCELNKDKIEQIGKVISSFQLPSSRWKLYQFAPIGYGAAIQSEYSLSTNSFLEIVKNTRQKYPQLKVDQLQVSDQTGRYLFIQPDGEATAIDAQIRPKLLGNLISHFTQTLINLSAHVNFDKNDQHGMK